MTEMRYTWIHTINEPRNFSNKKDSTVLAKNLHGVSATDALNLAIQGDLPTFMEESLG
jgi:hypothetical protein